MTNAFLDEKDCSQDRFSTTMRTHSCGELRLENANQEVVLTGWVNTYRHQGSHLIFFDLRDRHGLTQVTIDAEDNCEKAMRIASSLRREDVVQVKGAVKKRESKNTELLTGEIEIRCNEIVLLAKTEKPPILPEDKEAEKISEEARLRHRYIDLRRPKMQGLLELRHRVAQETRRFFDSHGFIEIETPLLITPTPEGARDFIVPSRHHEGKWYALPQSPQIFKQILMMSGCDRYLQICKCLRDEDPRADRQAEFTQIDLEMSFVNREDILNIMSKFAIHIFKEAGNIDLGEIEILPWKDAMETYGSDRPDLRNPLKFTDISNIAQKTNFKVFQNAIQNNGVIRALCIPKGAELATRKTIDSFEQLAKLHGAGGLPWTKYTGDGDNKGFEGGIAKFLKETADEIIATLNLNKGDLIFFGVGPYRKALTALGHVRLEAGKKFGLNSNNWRALWVIDFPMFDWDEDNNRWTSEHHPFTAPLPEQLSILETKPGECISAGYDLVVNGSEIGGGSIRINTLDIQEKVFALLGLSEKEASEKFGFLLDALRFGAPPMGGVAFGLDRLVMLMAGTENIRDVIAFPKTQNGADLMCEAPGDADLKHLQEMGIAINKKEEK